MIKILWLCVAVENNCGDGAIFGQLVEGVMSFCQVSRGLK